MFILATITSIILAIALKNSNVSYGVGLSLVIIASYYIILIIGKNLGVEGILSPILSAWLANISLLFIIIYSYRKYVF